MPVELEKLVAMSDATLDRREGSTTDEVIAYAKRATSKQGRPTGQSLMSVG